MCGCHCFVSQTARTHTHTRTRGCMRPRLEGSVCALCSRKKCARAHTHTLIHTHTHTHTHAQVPNLFYTLKEVTNIKSSNVERKLHYAAADRTVVAGVANGVAGAASRGKTHAQPPDLTGEAHMESPVSSPASSPLSAIAQLTASYTPPERDPPPTRSATNAARQPSPYNARLEAVHILGSLLAPPLRQV